ncbi:uncharacterized protein JCM10292_007443 [Rhodotorula paludigena]|uniref:uncharacterized protein n=1 Tax=Rhodotorula paludigena TaxID=86838 RepID=UPI00318104B8
MHKQYPEAVHRLLDNPDQIALSQWVTNALRNHFGDVYHRYMNADPGRKNPNDPLRCRFGAFPLFCFNFSGDEPVECVPHTDYKNPAGGICAVMAYGSFDSTKRHWLFFHDLGVALELPAGCCALYPSSLLLHSNVSLVEADSEQQVLLGKGLARGSMVWFAQATYMMLGELGMTASEAKKAGLDTEYEDVLGMFPQEML